VLVGHTADDQAETVLLNVLRGAAASGLAGMAARQGTIVRPLLDARRADTRVLCAAMGVSVFDDPMNDDRAFRRVAIRHDVLPQLSALAERDLVPVLARQADILRSDSEFLDDLAARAWPVDDVPRAAPLVALPAPLARRAVRRWLGAPPPSMAEVERVLAVASGRARATELAGGRRVRRSAGVLVLTVG
jgi:tRNA(Ile)-lysidine synthase